MGTAWGDERKWGDKDRKDRRWKSTSLNMRGTALKKGHRRQEVAEKMTGTIGL